MKKRPHLIIELEILPCRGEIILYFNAEAIIIFADLAS